MTRERTRGRSDAAAQPAKKQVGFRGSEGKQRVEEETRKIKERQNAPRMPYRFRAGYEPGKDVSPIVFLDDGLDNAFFFHEHNVQDERGNFGSKFEVCVKETDNCPLCKMADGGAKNIGRSNYTMLLTVLDLRPYTNRDGKEIPYSRKLFAVKGLQINDWMKTLERAEKKFGTLRGVYMEVGRSGQKEAGTGKPLFLEKNWYGEAITEDSVSDIIDEADLIAEYGHDALMSEDGKRVIKPADADVTAYDYAALVTFPDIDAMARQYGAKSRNAGSQADIEGEFDEQPRRGRANRTAAETPAAGGSSRRRLRDEVNEDAEDEGIPAAENDDTDDAPAPPKRTRQAEAVAETKPTSRRSRAAEPEDDADETPAPRTRARGKAAPEPEADEDDAPKTRTRKATKPAAAEEDEGEDDAPRTRVSRHARVAEKPAPAGRGRRAAAEAEDDDAAF